MGRLKALPSTLRPLVPVLGYQPGDERGRNQKRSNEQPWRAWYKTARWRRLAFQCFTRDLFKCQQTGALLMHKSPHPLSPVADHKIPHRGDPALFWDPDNIQTVAKEWHDSVKQRADHSYRGGGQKV